MAEYTEKQRRAAIERVIAGLKLGTPLTVICSAADMPCDDTVRIWAEKDEEIARAIARARETGFDQIALEGLKIVDDKEEDPASRRIRADYRLKLLAKWDPKRYGDLVKLSGADGTSPAVTALQVAFVKPGQETTEPDAG